MPNEIKVSILCITYNHEPYIRDCLEGFVTQKTNFPFEVLIHDDASTDQTAEIIREYEKKYPDIIKPIYQTENQYSKGVPIFLRYLCPRVQGEYVAICEGDDYWIDPQKLQKQYDFMVSHPECSGCIGGAKILNYTNGMRESIVFPTNESRYLKFEEVLEFGANYPTATFFFHRRQLEVKNAFADLKLSFGDYLTILSLALQGKVYAFHDIFSVYRFLIPGSWTEKHERDVEMAIRVRNQRAQLFQRINELTDNAYEQITKRLLLEQDAEILFRQGNLKELKKPCYREVYRKRFGPAARTKRFLRKHCPGFFDIKDRMWRKKHGK